MGDKTAKVSADNAVPGSTLTLVELYKISSWNWSTSCQVLTNRLLDVVCNVLVRIISICPHESMTCVTTYLLDVELLHCFLCCRTTC